MGKDLAPPMALVVLASLAETGWKERGLMSWSEMDSTAKLFRLSKQIVTRRRNRPEASMGVGFGIITRVGPSTSTRWETEIATVATPPLASENPGKMRMMLTLEKNEVKNQAGKRPYIQSQNQQENK